MRKKPEPTPLPPGPRPIADDHMSPLGFAIFHTVVVLMFLTIVAVMIFAIVTRAQ